MKNYLSDARYLIAYTAPLAAFAGLYLGGWFAPGSIYVGFVLIPLLEFFLPGTSLNLSDAEEREKSANPFFDILLYLNVPIVYSLVGYALWIFTTRQPGVWETVWMIANMGLIIGSSGINVGHELGHRSGRFDQWMARLLLLPALYLHFTIEHNRGHHKNVGTDLDPASARKGEMLYAFWLRSVAGNYRNAWRLEGERLRKAGLPFLSLHNDMVLFQFMQAAYLLLILWIVGWQAALLAVGMAVSGFLMLETVNYIEHYGLRRKRLENGHYEVVTPKHSWNSDHELGRIFLYELTRHSDHHYKATRKYQILRHHDESPQLPVGYPAAMLLSLLPPLWFRLMDRRVEVVSPRGAEKIRTTGSPAPG